MDEDGLDGAVATGDRRRSVRPLVVAVLVVAIVGVGAFAWVRTRPTLTRSCTAAGAVDTPIATSPQGAFDAWWAQRGPTDVESRSTFGVVPGDGRRPTKADFTRVSETFWEWRYAENRSIGVHVGTPFEPAPPGSWAVTGVNQCGYAPLGGW